MLVYQRVSRGHPGDFLKKSTAPLLGAVQHRVTDPDGECCVGGPGSHLRCGPPGGSGEAPVFCGERYGRNGS